jgi:hypothetical protein
MVGGGKGGSAVASSNVLVIGEGPGECRPSSEAYSTRLYPGPMQFLLRLLAGPPRLARLDIPARRLRGETGQDGIWNMLSAGALTRSLNVL